MEKLVMVYHGGDGCSYSYTETIPFEYESLNAIQTLFLDSILHMRKRAAEFREWRSKYTAAQVLAKGTKVNDEYLEFMKDNSALGEISFLGINIFCGIADEDFPEFMTLEDWYEKNRFSGEFANKK